MTQEEMVAVKQSQMRVAIYAPNFTEYAYLYAQSLAKYCRVLLFIKEEELPAVVGDHCNTPNLQIQTIKTAISIGSVLSLFKIIAITSRFKPDIIHYQEVPEKWTPILMLLFKPFFKSVITIHDPTPHSGQDSRLPRWLEIGRAVGRRLATYYVVHGKFCAEEIERTSKRSGDKIITSAHGIVMAPPSHRSANDNEFLFFGRMQWYKGLDIFVEAANILAAKGYIFKATVAGRGPELDRLAPEISKNRFIQVFNGLIPNEKAAELYQDAAALVMPYRDATQSGVIAAAMASHRPVIATRVGGIPDVIVDGKNGLLVPPESPTELANAMAKLMKDRQLLATLTSGARQTAEEQLNWDKISLDLYMRFQSIVRQCHA